MPAITLQQLQTDAKIHKMVRKSKASQ